MPVQYDEIKGCHVIKFEMRMDGKRIRKTKRMPPGITYDQAVTIEQRMLTAHEPHRDLKARLEDIDQGNIDAGWIYSATCGTGPIKIGMTRTSVDSRIRSFNTVSIEPWRAIGCVRVRSVQETEQTVHWYLAKRRVRTNRELFDISEAEAIEILGVVADSVEFINPQVEVGFRSLMAAASMHL